MSAAMTLFTKMTVGDTTRLLADLHERRGTVLFKFPDSGVFRVKTASKGWGQSVLAARPATLADSRRDQVVTGNFLVRGQMYFFNAKVRIQKKQIHLQLTGELQKLARRKQDRFPVPETVPLHLVTKRVGSSLVFLRASLLDLSVKGFRAAVITLHPELKVGAVVSGLLRFGSRKPIVVSGVIRHVKRPSRGRFDQIFGVELEKCDDLLRLQGWMVDLHREAFAAR